jgi:hypothetical protein
MSGHIEFPWANGQAGRFKKSWRSGVQWLAIVRAYPAFVERHDGCARPGQVRPAKPIPVDYGFEWDGVAGQDLLGRMECKLEKIRIVMEGLKGEETIAGLCRHRVDRLLFVCMFRPWKGYAGGSHMKVFVTLLLNKTPPAGLEPATSGFEDHYSIR